jgi:hypothetical protein
MTVMILAHGGHIAMFLMPVAAVIYLIVALRGDAPKRTNAGTPALPTNDFGRQVHQALSPQKAKKPTAPPSVPSRFAPGRAAKKPKKQGRAVVVPLHGTPPPDHGPDSPSLPSAWNQ